MSKKINPKNLILTGGTGFGPRDVTPEATKPLLEKECPGLCLALTLASLQKTKFAALMRGVCGIAKKTLIMNFPGSEKAVTECFESVKCILPHAFDLIQNDLKSVKKNHEAIQGSETVNHPHVCPHKVGSNSDSDRNSPYPMISLKQALDIIFDKIHIKSPLPEFLENLKSPVDIPPFRASIKDGYAMKSGCSGAKKVVGFINAGDPVSEHFQMWHF